MNKKAIAMAVSCALVAVVGIGSTFAYFTDKEEATNKVTMGHVDIELNESKDGKDFGDAGISYNDILPGESLNKDVTVTLKEGSADAYIRVKVEVKGADINDLKFTKTVEDVSGEKKVEEVKPDEDGYLYFVAESGKTIDVFDTVTVPTTWGNKMADKNFEINLSAEAVQKEFLADADKNEDGTPIWSNITVEEYPVAPQ